MSFSSSWNGVKGSTCIAARDVLLQTEASKTGTRNEKILACTIIVNGSLPHFHTVGLTKKRVHDVDEVCEEDFSPAACLRA